MKKTKTTYMGIELNSPIVLGACNVSMQLDKLKLAEDQGVGAIVYKSLFEEQIQLETLQLDEKLNEFNDIQAEMLTMHPKIEYSGYEEHLLNLRKAKESLSIPVIGSLNAVNEDTWIEYATLISETGVDGIELNFYQVPMDFTKDASSIEAEQVAIVKKIKERISIPVSVKLSSDYTNTLHVIKKMDEAGADAFVLFNAFFQPDIDINKEKHVKSFSFSQQGDCKKSLRFSGLLYDTIKADICSSHGVFSVDDVVKLMLSGSTCVQVVSSIYKHGLQHIGTLNNGLQEWMDSKNYDSIDAFKGKLASNNLAPGSLVYNRAQYVDLLIHSETIFGDTTT